MFIGTVADWFQGIKRNNLMKTEIGATGDYAKNGILNTLKTELWGSKRLIMNKSAHKQGGSQHDSSSDRAGEMKDAFKAF